MDIEIRTTTETWIAQVDPDAFEAAEQGVAAAHVSAQIKSGEALEVTERSDDAGVNRRRGPSHLVVFNPGHVICVVETSQRRHGRAV